MANISQAYYKMFILDELADKKTAVHRINPTIKVAVTLVFIIIAVSYGKYEISGIIPLFFYPILLMAVGGIPYKPMLAGLAIASPLVLGAGIFNPILDRTIVMTVGDVAISSGLLSFLSLMLKCCLTVLAGMLLLATTGIGNIAVAMQRMHIPDIFVSQLLLTYRYISVLMGETGRVYNAYSLRSPTQKGVVTTVWGSLPGLLLLRTFDRAVRLYQAMKLRGCGNQYFGANPDKINRVDILYFLGWTLFFLAARIFNLPMLLGLLVMRMII